MMNFGPEPFTGTGILAVVIGFAVPISIPWLISELEIDPFGGNKLFFGIFLTVFFFLWIPVVWKAKEAIEDTKIGLIINVVVAILITAAIVYGVSLELHSLFG